MIKGLTFQPWVSEAYTNNSGKYGKLLIIGESHYTEESDESEKDDVQKANDILSKKEDYKVNFTSKMIEGFIENEWDINFYRNIGLLFNPSDRYEIWKNVAFANAIQIALQTSDSQPNPNDIETVKNAFWLLLENLKPEKVIICSKRMWEKWLPDSDPRGRGISDINLDNLHSTVWEYNLNGNICHAIGINHPSSFFSYSRWEPFVKLFLQNKYQ